jgi:hypothetical protein
LKEADRRLEPRRSSIDDFAVFQVDSPEAPVKPPSPSDAIRSGTVEAG